MTPLGQLKFEGSVSFERMKFLISDGMNENKAFITVLAFVTIEDVNICLPTSGGKKVSSSEQSSNCIVSDHLKALFKLLLILFFYSKPKNIF